MPQDFILDENGDMKIEDGHFVIGESTYQHQRSLLKAQKGDFREFPFVGVGVANFLNDEEIADLGFEIQKQFELDGMKIRKLEVNRDFKLKIDARYE